MQHERRRLGVLGSAVGQAEARGEVEVDLDRRALPRAADGVLELDVDLGAVEGAVALVDLEVDAALLQRLDQRVGGNLPVLVLADRLLGTRGDLGGVLEAEDAHHVVDEIEHADDLVVDLLGGAEDVRVVLSEATSAHEPVYDAGKLVAVDGAELADPHRQIAVAAHVVVEDQHVAGAVHRLDGVLVDLAFALVDVEEVHVLAVEVVVPADLPDVGLVDVRRDGLFVAALVEHAAQPLLHEAQHARALGVVERQTGARDLVEAEQVELLAELAVVALLGLLQAREVGVEVLLREPRGAVDALQHRPSRVAAPVGAGDLGELEGADTTGGRARAGLGRGR